MSFFRNFQGGPQMDPPLASREALRAIEELQTRFRTEVHQDPVSQSIVALVQPFVDELILSLTVDHRYLSSGPVAGVYNGSGEYQKSLELLIRCGLMDPDTRIIRFEKVFGWKPSMRLSSLVYLVCVVIRSVGMVAKCEEKAKGSETPSDRLWGSPSRSPGSEEGTNDVVFE